MTTQSQQAKTQVKPVVPPEKPLWRYWYEQLDFERTGSVIKQTNSMSVRDCMVSPGLYEQVDTHLSFSKDNFPVISPPMAGGELVRCSVKPYGPTPALLHGFLMSVWKERAFKESVSLLELAHEMVVMGMAINLFQLNRFVRDDLAGKVDAKFDQKGGTSYFVVHNGKTSPGEVPIVLVSLRQICTTPRRYATSYMPLLGASKTATNEGDAIYFTALPGTEAPL